MSALFLTVDCLKGGSSSSYPPHPLLPLLPRFLSTADDSYDLTLSTMSYQAPVMYDTYSNRSLGGGLRSRRQSFSHGADPYYSTPINPVSLHSDVSARPGIPHIPNADSHTTADVSDPRKHEPLFPVS